MHPRRWKISSKAAVYPQKSFLTMKFYFSHLQVFFFSRTKIFIDKDKYNDLDISPGPRGHFWFHSTLLCYSYSDNQLGLEIDNEYVTNMIKLP